MYITTLYIVAKMILKMLTYISQNREIDKAIVLLYNGYTLYPIKGQ